MSVHTMHTALSRAVPVPDERSGAPYLEIAATWEVHNRYLRLALLGCCAAIVAMAAAGWKLSREYANVRPLVVRVSEAGDTVVAPYTSLEYQPREPEVRHFLMRFVQDHYSRVRATAQAAFQRKLFFLGSNLARAAMEEESRSKSLQSFLVSGDDEVEVYVTNVAVEDLRQAPYKAAVQFEKVFRSPGDGRELKRERYTAHFVFTLLDRVPNNSSALAKSDPPLLSKIDPVNLM
jgi:type IV secretory pathway TrbF-like protein